MLGEEKESFAPQIWSNGIPERVKDAKGYFF